MTSPAARNCDLPLIEEQPDHEAARTLSEQHPSVIVSVYTVRLANDEEPCGMWIRFYDTSPTVHDFPYTGTRTASYVNGQEVEV